MKDPFKIVGERVRHWAEKNNPKDGKGTYIASKSKMRIERQKINFGTVLPGEIRPRGVYQAEWQNNTSVEGIQNFSVAEKTTNSTSWSVTAGLTVSTKFTAKVPFVGEAENSLEMRLDTTNTQTETTERSWNYATQVRVPAYSRVVSSFIVNEATYNVPFTAQVTVRGRVYIKFQNGRVYNKEIDFMINEAGWSPATFNVATEGTMDGVVGETFTVRTDEYGLDGSRAAVERVIDRGHWSGGHAVSTPGLEALEPA